MDDAQTHDIEGRPIAIGHLSDSGDFKILFLFISHYDLSSYELHSS